MEDRTVYIIIACVLAACIAFLPKLIQLRVWGMRKMHLYKGADWLERHSKGIIMIFQIIFAIAVLVMLMLAAEASYIDDTDWT